MAAFEACPEILAEMRRMRQAGCLLTEILRYLIPAADISTSGCLLAIIYVREAFGMELARAIEVRAWEYFEGGTWSDQELNERVPL